MKKWIILALIISNAATGYGWHRKEELKKQEISKLKEAINELTYMFNVCRLLLKE